jgi:phage/plasmid-associated DNA primase
MDRGVQRRLLVITFNRTIPQDERVESIGLRIAEEEADWLLIWAVAGASRLIAQRDFTTPPSSKAVLREWLLGADPVLAWLQACVEVVDPNSPDAKAAIVKSSDAYREFSQWAKREGFREDKLPARNSFVMRLRANCSSIDSKHTNKCNFITGIRIVSPESETEGTEFFPSRLTLVKAG